MKSKWLVVLVLSLAFGLNHLYGQLTHAGYTPFALTGVSRGGAFDEVYYVSPITAVSYNKPLGDWLTYEYRYGPAVQPTLGPLIFGRVAKMIGLDNLYILVDFIFPPLIFLTFYYLTKLLTENELLSVLAPLIFIGQEPLKSFGLKLAAALFKYGRLGYFFDYLNSLNRPLGLARFDSPQFSFLVLTLSLIVFFKAVNGKRIIYYLLAGILFGLLWFIYSYYAVFAGLVLAAAFLLTRRREILLAVLGALAVSAPYWWNYWQFTRLPQALDWFYRAGRVDGRWFDVGSLWLVPLIIIVFKIRPKLIFLLSVLLAAFLSPNLQLLTGFSVQPFHWQSAVVTPAFILASVYLLSLFKSPVLVKPLILLIGVLTLAIFFRNFLVARNTAAAYFKNEDLEQAYGWINQNLDRQDVVVTPSIESNFNLVMKTKVYGFTPHALHSLAPTAELVDRWAVTFNLFGVDPGFADRFLTFHSSPGVLQHTHESLDLNGYDYIFYLKYGLTGPQSPEAKAAVNEAKTKLKTDRLTWREAKKKYRLDYVFFGPSERRISNRDLAEDQQLVKVFDNQVVQIFRISD